MEMHLGPTPTVYDLHWNTIQLQQLCVIYRLRHLKMGSGVG
jgi:hypothetical protein